MLTAALNESARAKICVLRKWGVTRTSVRRASAAPRRLLRAAGVCELDRLEGVSETVRISGIIYARALKNHGNTMRPRGKLFETRAAARMMLKGTEKGAPCAGTILRIAMVGDGYLRLRPCIEMRLRMRCRDGRGRKDEKSDQKRLYPIMRLNKLRRPPARYRAGRKVTNVLCQTTHGREPGF